MKLLASPFGHAIEFPCEKFALALGLTLSALWASSPARSPCATVLMSLPIASPVRVISLSPDMTELMYSLKLEDSLVGVSEFSDFPPPAQQKTKVGSFVAPNLEKILELKPDLILAREGATPPNLLYALQQRNIEHYISRASSEKDIFENILYLGKKFKKEKIASKIILEHQKKLAILSKKLKTLQKPSVLIQIETAPTIIAGQNTLMSRAIELAGGINAATEFRQYPRLQTEHILKLNPSFIIFAVPNGAAKMMTQEWMKWPHMEAVQKNHLYTVQADLLSRASLRYFDGIVSLAKILHPELKNI